MERYSLPNNQIRGLYNNTLNKSRKEINNIQIYKILTVGLMPLEN
jgi:hypothetical protein